MNLIPAENDSHCRGCFLRMKFQSLAPVVLFCSVLCSRAKFQFDKYTFFSVEVNTLREKKFQASAQSRQRHKHNSEKFEILFIVS